MELGAAIVALACLFAGIAAGTVWGYRLGLSRGLLRARGIVVTIGTRPQELGAMPPLKAWGLLTDRLLHAIDRARE